MDRNNSYFKGEVFYETLFEQSPAGIAVQGLDGRVVRANRTFCEMFGYSPEEVEGVDLDRLVAVEPDLADLASELSRTVLRGEDSVVESTRSRKDGSRFPVLIRGVPIRQEGKVAAVYAIYEDITVRKKAEADLRRERAHFERIMLDSPDGIVVFNRDGMVMKANPAFERLFGIEPGEAEGKPLCDIVGSGESRQEVLKNIDRLKNEGFVDIETRRYRKDGKELFVSARGAHILLNGGVREFLGIYRDISEKKRFEEELATEKSYFENLFSGNPLAVVLVDSSGIIQRVNEAFEELFGYGKGECIGKALDSLIVPEGKFEDAAHLTVEVAQGRRLKAERIRQRKDGTLIDVQISAVSFSGIAGQAVVYAIYQDITERKLLEEHTRFLSYHDSLTGLYNQAFIEEEIQRLDTPRQLPISVIMADLDNLKLVNDAFGHMEGDKLILEAGNMLRSCCRQEDIVARCGGDEFILLLPGTSSADAKTICDRIRRGCENQGGRLISLSLAVGTATKEDVTEDFLHILKKADDDMYLDKLLRSDRSREDIFRRLEAFLESDHRRKTHIEGLSGLAVRFGEYLSMRKGDVEKLRLLARYHDVGLIPVPADILYRDGPLDPEEMEMIRKHPERGYHIAKNLPAIAPVAEGILSHQETFDGRGYPRRLSGEDIPLHARIIHLLCAYEVMTGWRPYGPVLTGEEALEEIEAKAGSQFDPRLAGLFKKMLS